MPLNFEELDARALPSLTFSLPSILGTSPPVLIWHHATALHAMVAGNYMGQSLIVDAGLQYTLLGTATFCKLGSFSVSGWLQGVGRVAEGRVSGQLIVSNSRGSITLSLLRPVERGFGPLPSEFAYTVNQRMRGTPPHDWARNYESLADSGPNRLPITTAVVIRGGFLMIFEPTGINRKKTERSFIRIVPFGSRTFRTEQKSIVWGKLR